LQIENQIMNLVIDVGNTRIKCALFERNRSLNTFIFFKNELQKSILEILEKYKKISNIIVSSVGKLEKKDFNFIKKDIFFITNEIQFPFKNLYETPKTLGIDRMVLATGAVLQFPNQNRLVIDAGTCITYDFINIENQYLGGAISPGILLRYESLHNYTAKLPLLTIENPEKLIGNSTLESIHSGVINGLTNEIDGFIDQYKEQYSNFIIILTGGDADFLAKRLKNIIFANSNFLLESLNQTYQYNFKND
jgi:type III pantothenate kinase